MIGLILHLVVFDWSTIRQSYHFFQPLCMYQQTNVAFSPKIILYKFSENIRCCLFITSLGPCASSSPMSPSLQVFEFSKRKAQVLGVVFGRKGQFDLLHCCSFLVQIKQFCFFQLNVTLLH